MSAVSITQSAPRDAVLCKGPRRVTIATSISMTKRALLRVRADGRRFFAGLLDGARLSSDDRLNIRAKARRHARQYVAESLPGFTASFRCLRHAVKHEREAKGWRARRSASILRINATAAG